MPSAARRLHPQGFIAPCLSTLARDVPDGPHWAHEIKHDGYRMICRREADRVRIVSRNALDWTDKVPAIVETMRTLPANATIDGEAVVCDPQGVTDFDALRDALARRGGSAIERALPLRASATLWRLSDHGTINDLTPARNRDAAIGGVVSRSWATA
jgi:ATP-dependent DNA ligase